MAVGKLKIRARITFEFEGSAMQAARESAGIETASEMAKVCGHSKVHQSRLENPGQVHRVTDSLMCGLHEAGIVLELDGDSRQEIMKMLE